MEPRVPKEKLFQYLFPRPTLSLKSNFVCWLWTTEQRCIEQHPLLSEEIVAPRQGPLMACPVSVPAKERLVLFRGEMSVNQPA